MNDSPDTNQIPVNQGECGKTRYSPVGAVIWLVLGVGLLAMVVLIPIRSDERITRRFYLVGFACTALAWGIARLRKPTRDQIKMQQQSLPNHPTEPSPTSGTSAAEHPPRQP